MLLTGCFNRSLDEKSRVAVPKRFREAMGCAADGAVYVTPGTDGSLAIYTEEAFGRWAERLSQASPTRQDVRAFARLFYGQAQRIELDVQGRVRIPPRISFSRVSGKGRGVGWNSGPSGAVVGRAMEGVPGGKAESV